MSTLAQQAQRGVLWNTSFSLFRDVLQFGVTLILVRYLSPDVYGQYGLVNGIIGFLYVFSFRSFVAYTLQIRGTKEVHYQDHFTAGGVIHLGMFVITNLAAALLRPSETYGGIAFFLHIMSPIFLFHWPSEFRVKMLEKDLNWARLRFLQAIGLVLSASAAVLMAANGLGVYALILPGMLVPLPFVYDLFLVEKWRPNWKWSCQNYRPALRFGRTRILSEVVTYGRPLLEGAVFVQMYGFAGFGIFGRAVGLAQIVCFKFAFLLLQSIYPVLTRIEPETPSYERACRLVLSSVSWIVIPLAVVCAILAEPLVLLIYGENWLEAVPLLPWAFIAGVSWALYHGVYMLALANQQQSQCLQVDVVLMLGTSISLYGFLPLSIPVYFCALAGVQGLGYFYLLYGLSRNRSIAPKVIFNSLIPPVAAALGSWIMCEGARTGWDLDLHSSVIAAAYGLAFAVMYCVVLRLAFSSLLSELVRWVPGGQHLSRILILAR